MFQYDAAIHQDRIHIGARFGVDKGVERMIQGPQKHGIGAQEHQVGFIARSHGPKRVGHTEDAGTPTRREFPGRLGTEPARWLMGKAHFTHESSKAHGFEQILIVGAHRAIGPQADRKPLFDHLAHWRNAATQLEITRRVVRYCSTSVRELSDVIVCEPDPMGADKVRAESAELGEMAHQGLTPAALAGNCLDF